jgi:hypothetical protein
MDEAAINRNRENQRNARTIGDALEQAFAPKYQDPPGMYRPNIDKPQRTFSSKTDTKPSRPTWVSDETPCVQRDVVKNRIEVAHSMQTWLCHTGGGEEANLAEIASLEKELLAVYANRGIFEGNDLLNNLNDIQDRASAYCTLDLDLIGDYTQDNLKEQKADVVAMRTVLATVTGANRSVFWPIRLRFEAACAEIGHAPVQREENRVRFISEWDAAFAALRVPSKIQIALV